MRAIASRISSSLNASRATAILGFFFTNASSAALSTIERSSQFSATTPSIAVPRSGSDSTLTI